MNSYAMLMQTVPTLTAHTTASANLDLLEMIPVVQVGALLETFRFEDEYLFRVFLNIYNPGQLHGSFCLQKRLHSYFNVLKEYKPSPEHKMIKLLTVNTCSRHNGILA